MQPNGSASPQTNSVADQANLTSFDVRLNGKSTSRERHMFAFTVNGQRRELALDGETPLLWVLREHLKMTGTKFGCGVAACGACTVHVDGMSVRSCITTLSMVEGRMVTTIEGLSPDGTHPLQKAWLAEQVPQCGYCHSGQIMQAATMGTLRPTDAERPAAPPEPEIS